MKSIYFEWKLNIHAEFHDIKSKRRDHHSITGFFNLVGWFANIAFVIAQGAALCSGIHAARTLLVSMIIILICEYLRLFLSLQTNSNVGRFVLSVVTILERDLLGFLVVFVIIQLVFTICFLLLLEEDDVWHGWSRAFFIWYELSVGTGEWFKERLDDIEAQENEMDSCRKALFYVTYVTYISITLVILLNLLIAVMSETTNSLSEQMGLWERNLKLSSVSLLARRLRAMHSIARFFKLNKIRAEKKWTTTMGGETGHTTKILEGRIQIREEVAKNVRASTIHFSPRSPVNDALEAYFSQMRYWSVLVHEGIGINKDGRQIDKDSRKPTKQQYECTSGTLEIVPQTPKNFFCEKLVQEDLSNYL